MRNVIVAVAALAVGCGESEPREVANCESYILKNLRSPSTYHRVELESVDLPYPEPYYRQITISYDAANAYGTPVRDEESCFYPLSNGSVTTVYFDQEGAVSDAINRTGVFDPVSGPSSDDDAINLMLENASYPED